MSYAHTACIQQWINEKGDMSCEICKQPFTGSFIRPPPQPPLPVAAPVPFFRGFLIAGDTPRRGLPYDYAEPQEERASALWCLAAFLVFMMLMLLWHAFEVFSVPKPLAAVDATSEVDPSGNGASLRWDAVNVSVRDTMFKDYPSLAAPGSSEVDFTSGPGEYVSPGLIIAWLVVRLGMVLIPAVIAYRLLAHFRDARRQEEQQQQMHAAVLWNLEAGAGASAGQRGNGNVVVELPVLQQQLPVTERARSAVAPDSPGRSLERCPESGSATSSSRSRSV